ncbi:MAG: hypothetical protein H0U32_07715, partial [Thermoleophilaceae bacterium]|nr:hypothetical protein [Thermoleophilaceae bacterium]
PWARLGTALAALAALIVVGVVAYALLASDGPSPSRTVEPVDRGDVQQQIDDLRQFLSESSR